MEDVKKLKEIKLLIAIPTRGEFKSDFGLSLCWLVAALSTSPVIEIEHEPHIILWNIATKSSSNIASLRQKFVDMAVANEVTHLLFLDDDMVFDHNLVHDWLTKKYYPVIACNCPTRGVPTYPTARQRGGRMGTPVYSDVASTRFEKVWRVGTGIMMLQLDALKKLPRPAFTHVWNEDLNDYNGEDWGLVENLEKAGISVVVDHKHSLSVKHVGTHAFSHEMVAGQRRIESPLVVTNSGPVLTEAISRN